MEYKVERDGTLLPFLLERMEGRSRSSVKSYLTHGQVAVNGCHTTRHDTPLTAGDTVTVTKHRTAGTLFTHQRASTRPCFYIFSEFPGETAFLN